MPGPMNRVHVRRIDINESAIERVVATAPAIQYELQKKLMEIQKVAEGIYLASAQGLGKESETSPPRYVRSFEIKEGGGVGKWRLYNVDPGAIFVEFGTHPGGGETLTLGYRPMGKAIVMVGRF